MFRGSFWLLVTVIGGMAIFETVREYWYLFLIALVFIILLVIYAEDPQAKNTGARQKSQPQSTTASSAAAVETPKLTLWLDQTAEQLIETRGKPCAVDYRISKRRICEIWKYEPHRGGYRLRVTLENDRVVSWRYRG
ncbi:hypothetical protein [Cupriavidus necator]|uniref:hypothetical protein n=1 Tax=Cupriavidus necator TaxID=106590 RepID=UPI0039C11241